METITVANLTLFFDDAERDTAELVRHACEKSVQTIQENWGLDTPKDCRVYVMTSWLHFVFHSAPWLWRILLVLFFPLWNFRVRKMWRIAGGWAQQYGKRRAIGVKPARLIQHADRSMGDRIFVKQGNVNGKIQHITCHELTHAFAAHLKLPMWLNKGLAMATVDGFAGQATVRTDTIEVFERSSRQASVTKYQDLKLDDQDAIVYQCVRGYWIARFFQDTQAELLKSVLSHRYSHDELETKLAAALGMDRDEFWSDIDGILLAHFKQGE